MAFDMREYRKVYMPAYRAAHPEVFREFDKRRYDNARMGAIRKLGSSCVICCEDELEFLTIDHVFNDGAVERANRHHRLVFQSIVRGIVDLSRYRVLCRNCNSGRSIVDIHNSVPRSAHAFTGDPCRKCGRAKLVRTSSHPLYGTRKRSECRYCERDRNGALRRDALKLFGGSCRCCAQSDPAKLTFDHLRENGNVQRGSDHCGTAHFYRRLLREDLNRTEYQLLCWNCNFSKHLGGGTCVHQRKE